jgi:hypothetical protein
MVMNFQVPQNVGSFVTDGFSRRAQLREVSYVLATSGYHQKQTNIINEILYLCSYQTQIIIVIERTCDSCEHSFNIQYVIKPKQNPT